MSCVRVGALLLLAFGLTASAEVSYVCDDDLSSGQLTQAIDAAITSLMGTPGWLIDLKITNDYTHALDIASCTPDDNKWAYPAESEATGLLKRVLDNQELRVAGVQWALPGAADYITDPENPSGFWPDYLTAIVDKLSEAYGKEIKLVRKYYDSSPLVVDAVVSAIDVEMSEPYYYLSGFLNNDPRIEAMGFSCVTAGSGSQFFVKASTGITDLEGLNEAITNGLNTGIVGFIGQGNYDSVSAALPKSVVPAIITNSSAIETGVANGEILAGYLSEGSGGNLGTDYNVFPSGVISPRVVLFRKELPVCPAEATSAADAGLPYIIAVIVLGCVALVLAGILCALIVKERQGSPMFMPLLEKNELANGMQMT